MLTDSSDNASFISSDSNEYVCMICYMNNYSMHDLTCCNKIICTECVTNWQKKQPIQDSLCVFCKKPNYIFQHFNINLEEEEDIPSIYNQICMGMLLCSILGFFAVGIYFFSFYT